MGSVTEKKRNIYDQSFKFLATNYPHDFAKLVLGTDELSISGFTGEVNIPQLRTDNLHIVEWNGNEFGLHLEFQLEHDKEVPRRMFLYNALFESMLKIPVFSTVFYIERVNYQQRPPSSYSKQQGPLAHFFHYPVVYLWEHLDEIREGKFPGLSSIQMLLTEEKSAAMLSETRTLIDKVESDFDLRLQHYGIAATIAGRFNIAPEIIKEIFKEEYEMIKEKNTFFELLRNEGKEEGMKEGKEEGREEGAKEKSQEFIVKTLQSRFGNIDPELKGQIEQIREGRTLEELFDTSLQVNSINDFKKVLARQSKGFSG